MSRRAEPVEHCRLARREFAAASLGDAHEARATFVTADADALIADPGIEVIVEATGVPGPASITR